MRVTWLGHATVALDLDGTRVLTDPLLRRHAGPLRRVGPTPDPDTWAGADAVLVSHLHADHASVASLKLVADVPMVSGPANERWLATRVGAAVSGAAEGAWVPVSGAVSVRLVRADHAARPMPHRPNDTHGHLVRGPEATVWFAGDTSLYDDMAGLPDQAGARIDLALLPIGGWGPRLSPGHMGPAEAVEACRRVRPRAVMPIHYGTFHAQGMQLASLDWMTRPARQFRKQLAAACPDVQLVDVALGGSADL